MSLTVPNSVLEQAGLNERQAQIEIACRFFDAGRLTKVGALKWLGMSRSDFEQELLNRGIPLFRWTADDLQQDLNTSANLPR